MDVAGRCMVALTVAVKPAKISFPNATLPFPLDLADRVG